MFERFTRSAKAAVVLAQESAGELNAREIGPEHLLVGAAQSAGHDLSAVLGGYGLTVDAIRARLVAGDGDEEFEGDAEALRSIGINLHAIRDGIARTFGPDAWDDAFRKSGRRRRRRGHIVLGILRGGDRFTMGIITEHVSATQLRESIVAVLDQAA
jgi:ATP-dependent Clp protease ATP-binding subunit ClpA